MSPRVIHTDHVHVKPQTQRENLTPIRSKVLSLQTPVVTHPPGCLTTEHSLSRPFPRTPASQLMQVMLPQTAVRRDFSIRKTARQPFRRCLAHSIRNESGFGTTRNRKRAPTALPMTPPTVQLVIIELSLSTWATLPVCSVSITMMIDSAHRFATPAATDLPALVAVFTERVTSLACSGSTAAGCSFSRRNNVCKQLTNQLFDFSQPK